MSDKTVDETTGWFDKFVAAMKSFVDFIADVRIPPDLMPTIPARDLMNVTAGAFSVVLYSAAAYLLTASNLLTSDIRTLMVLMGALLLFVSAIVGLAIGTQTSAVREIWSRTTSLFLGVWLLSLVVFLILTYPPWLVAGARLFEEAIYSLNSRVFGIAESWFDNVVQSMICSLLAGLFIVYRTKRIDPAVSWKSAKLWLWLALTTIVVGFIFYVSLFYSFSA